MSTATSDLTAKQQIALKILKGEPERGHNQWAHVKLSDLIEQLESLVKDPDLVNQGQSNWCGPAAALRNFAKEAPDQYVDMVLDLVHYGKAKFHHGKTHHAMSASRRLRQFDFKHKTSDIRAADWVPLATMREHLRSAHGHATASTLEMGTKPADVVRYYRAFWLYAHC